MKTPGSRKWSARRIRSPSSAPCVNGLDGSTEITPTVRSSLAHVADERADQRRLADAGRAGDADHERRARLRVELAHELVRERVAVLDERDRARERAPVAGADAGGEILERPRAAHAQALGRRRPRARAVRASARTRAPAADAGKAEARGSQDPARAEGVGERPGDDHAEPEDGVVRGHDHGERAAPQLVRRAALDEQRVADDGGAVPDRADDHDAGTADARCRRHAAQPKPSAISAIPSP